MHIIFEHSEEAGLSDSHSIPLVGENDEKKLATAFNNADVDVLEDRWYNDSGVRYSYRIDNNGLVFVTVEGSPEVLIEHPSDVESKDSPVKGQRGQIGIHFVDSRKGQLLRDLEFDLIAASGNRVFVREKGTANFYFASMKHEFINNQQFELDENWDSEALGAWVPGVYATLDAEHGKKILDLAKNPATNKKYFNHPSLKAFSNLDGGLKQIVAGLAYEGLRVAKVYPQVWHRLDTRPPYGSGYPPWFIDTFEHVTYEGALGVQKTYNSIKIYGVLDIGVGHTHRVLHHETKYGDEVDTMNKGAYPAIAGPIEDGGGFCDGMCNFYVLCKIKIRPNLCAPYNKETYAILWIDEQTYFCERWRLIGFEDTDQNLLRAWGIAAVYSAHNVKSSSYWSPFEASWISDLRHITNSSRLAVSKHTLVVNGLGPVRTLHPDNVDEKAPSTVDGKTPLSKVLYSMNYTFATSDRTWRWRGYPCRAETGSDWATKEQGAACYPETVKIREDMTIYLKGENSDCIRGYWYQKYLPADNTQVPNMPNLNEGIPNDSYNHGWSFAEQKVFEAFDKYSHFGVHKKCVDSRSQYYLLEILDEDELPSKFESIPWRDEEDRLYWFYSGVINPPSLYNDPPPPFNVPPPQFNNNHNKKGGSFFKILDRRPLGFIAVWFDKRDDEIPGVNRIGGEILLKPFNTVGASIFTRSFQRSRKLSPPVVQCAKVFMKVHEGAIEEFSLRFYTRMFLSLDFDFQTPDEPNDGLDWDFTAQDSSIRDYITRHTPPYLMHDNNPLSRAMFKPDTTIFKAHITVENNGTIVTIFDEKIAGLFSRRSRYEYVYKWRRSSNEQPHPQEANLLRYCTENAAGLGTSVWFEDIVGHVATPERIIFNFDED